ncbi:uncharacterized protein [Prorops nasuta]|uniref:uncharacterized protein n=1 Tax=Prorops nasuta TaxID=863751 RepID=UPI0034CD70E5
MIKTRLMWWAENMDIIPQSQSGFRGGRSCFDNLATLSLTVEEAFHKGHDVLACFLDVQGAFDNVLCDVLITKLTNLGCPFNIISFVQFLTFSRQVSFMISSVESTSRLVSKGLPQGGVLSPLLYLIYVSDIMKGLHSKIIVSQFADDIGVFLPISTPPEKFILENAIGHIDSNLSNLGLSLSPEKPILIHFNKKGIKPGSCSIKINGHKIFSSESTKFLGIIYDFQYNFKAQIDEIRRKSFNKLNLLKFISGIRWGANTSTLLTLYKSLIRSGIDYNSFIYFPKKQRDLLAIEKIQFSAIRISMGYRISTPTNILLGESKICLLQHRSKFLCNKFIAKCISINSSFISSRVRQLMFSPLLEPLIKSSHSCLTSCIKNVRSYYQSIRTDIKLTPFLTDYCPSYSFDTDTSLGLLLKSSPSPNLLFLDHLSYLPPNTITIFTDGSKNNQLNKVGAACYSPELKVSSQSGLLGYMSSFTAECIAILMGLNLLTGTTFSNTHIYTDCLSVINALTSPSLHAHYNPYLSDIKNLINIKFNNKHRVNIFWIPSHSGIHSNEHVDLLAKEASDFDISPRFLCPWSDLSQKFMSQALKKNDDTLLDEATYKGTQFFLNFFHTNKSPWFTRKALPRDFTCWVNRVRSNHYHLGFSLARIGIIEDPKCPCGSDQQDLNHVIWQCPFLEKGRDSLLQSLIQLRHYPPHSIECFLVQPSIKPFMYIHKFLKKNNIFP